MKKLLLILLCVPLIGLGQAWTFSSLSFPYNLNDVYFVNDTVGFAVGDNGIILSSNDGGDNWVVVNSGTTNNLVDILFYNDTVGYICSKDDGNPNNGGNGIGGTLLKTTDCGNTWNIVYFFNDDIDLNKIGLVQAPNTNLEKLYLLGTYIQSGNTDAVLIELDLNPFPSYTISTLSNHLYINDAFMPYYNTFIAVGYPNVGSSYGSFRRVGGVNMNMTSPYSINFNSIDHINSTNKCIMVGNAFAFTGSGGVIYELDNMYDQNNYQLNLNSFTSIHNFNSVDMIGNRGWVVGDGGVMANTTDGGSTWSAYSNSNFQDLNSVFLLDSCNGWIVGNSGIISKISCVLGCTDVLACNYNPSATIDDGNCIYTTSTTFITAFNNYTWNGVTYTESGTYEVSSSPGNIGDLYQGGVIFYLDGNGGGLISDISDLCNAYWGCPWSIVNTDYLDGTQNSLNIMNQCADPMIAARLCDNSYNQGYSDWYLPSKGQLDEMYNNKTAINNESVINGGSVLLNGNSDYYLSSSDYIPNQISNSVWIKKMANGGDGYTGKNSLHNIRAIRNISTIPASVNGCDSTAILNLTITNPTTPIVNNTSSLFSIASCDSYTWNGNTYYSSGTYSDTTIYSTGCINIDSLVLIINNSTGWQQSFSICDGDSVVVGNSVYDTIGNYVDTLTASNSCDSIVYTNVSMTPPVIWQQSFSICDGDNVTVGNSVYDTTGNYIDTLTAFNSCDSIVYTNVIVDNNTSSYDTLSVTTGIIWNGISLSMSGDYSITLINSVGCDSIVNLNLTIISSTSIEENNYNKELIKITNILGQEIPYRKNTPLFYIYNDGTVEKKIIIE